MRRFVACSSSSIRSSAGSRAPRADRERFAAGPGGSLEADLEAALDALDATLQSWAEGHGPITLRERADEDELLWFHADERDVFPLVRTRAGLRLHFEPGFVVS